MSRVTYLGHSLSIAGRKSPVTLTVPTSDPLAKLTRAPAMGLRDPNGEPLEFDFTTEAPSPQFETIRNIHVVLLSTNSPPPSTWEEWLALEVPKGSVELSGDSAQSVSIQLANVPDGDFTAQSIIEAGDE